MIEIMEAQHQLTSRLDFVLLRRLTPFILIAVITSGCSKGEKSKDKAPELIQSEVSIQSEKGPRILGTIPDFSLTDQTGKPFGTTDLYGKVWIANFFFTKCTATCPQQTAQMADLQKQLEKDPRWDEIRLLSISVDPEKDTVEALQEYANQTKADEQHWKFLTGDRETIWNLSKEGFKLGVGEAPENTAMPLFHSSKFVLVDAQGRVRGYFDGMTKDGVNELTKNLKLLFDERVAVPQEILKPLWLEGRKQAQLKTASRFKVFHDFQFSDQIVNSGIQFRNKIVDDAGKHYKAVHYDHGNGVSIADVDGDGLFDLYFTTQVGSNQLWKNLGEGKFEDITEAAGVGVVDPIGVTSSFADIDNDGDPDLYVTSVRGGNFLFENDGSGKFKDITQESGLAYSGHSSSGVFFDYNRDGLLDLFLCNVGVYTTDEKGRHGYYVGFKDAFAGHLKPAERNEKSILYKNLGNNRFQDVSEEMKLVDVSWAGDASPIDANEDGWPDLYVLNMQGHDEYYENIEGKHFEKKSLKLFPKTPWGSMGIKAFDYDNDGHQDIFITDMHSDMSAKVGPSLEKAKSVMRFPERMVQSGAFSTQPGRENIWGNAFYHKQSDGSFKEVSDPLGAENYWPWGLSAGDLNADGFEDVFIASSMCYPFRYAVNSVLLNNQGKKFLDSEFILGVEPRRNGRTAVPWFNLDCSGKDQGHNDCKNRNGSTVVWSSIGSKSSVIFDLDQDGDLDIVTNDCNTEPQVLISNLAEKQKELHYLKLKLIGSKSNRDGLGAVVKVKAGAKTYTKVYDGVTGYLSHGLYPLYFGLGNSKAVDSIEIVWPSGTKQTLEGPIKTNQTIELKEK